MAEEQLKEFITKVRNRYNGQILIYEGIDTDGNYILDGEIYTEDSFIDNFDIIDDDEFKRALNYFNGRIKYAQLYGQEEAYQLAIALLHKYRPDIDK